MRYDTCKTCKFAGGGASRPGGVQEGDGRTQAAVPAAHAHRLEGVARLHGGPPRLLSSGATLGSGVRVWVWGKDLGFKDIVLILNCWGSVFKGIIIVLNC